MEPEARTPHPPVASCPDSDADDEVGGAHLGWALSAVTRAFGQWAAAAVVDLPGGPRSHLVLASIVRGHAPSQLALANQLGLDRTVMTYLLDELQAAGYVERRPDPVDRRARQILITEPGRTALRHYGERLTGAERRLLAPLGRDEADAFRHMLEQVACAAQAALNLAGPEDADVDPPVPTDPDGPREQTTIVSPNAG